MEVLKRLSLFKEDLYYYAKNCVDLEPNETLEEWCEAYLDALKEEGSIVTIDNEQYVKMR